MPFSFTSLLDIGWTPRCSVYHKLFHTRIVWVKKMCLTVFEFLKCLFKYVFGTGRENSTKNNFRSYRLFSDRQNKSPRYGRLLNLNVKYKDKIYMYYLQKNIKIPPLFIQCRESFVQRINYEYIIRMFKV